LKSYFQSESPAATRLNELDKYLLFSLLFVVGALVEFAFVVLLSRRKQLRSNGMENASTFNGKEVPNIDATLRQRIKMKNRIKDEGFMASRLKENDDCKGKETSMFDNTPIHVIDFVAFVLFLSMYILFIAVYIVSQF
jgi:hypothetical protein